MEVHLLISPQANLHPIRLLYQPQQRLLLPLRYMQGYRLNDREHSPTWLTHKKIANESPYRGHISSTYQGNSSTLPCTTRETSTNQSISSSLTKPGKQILKNRTNSTNRETRQCLTLQSYILKMSTCISHHFSTHRVALVLNTGEHCP